MALVADFPEAKSLWAEGGGEGGKEGREREGEKKEREMREKAPGGVIVVG